MTATVVWKLTDWNNLITQVNTLAQQPPDGCNAVNTLDPVTDPHRWSKTDIQQMQDTLKQICSDNTFATIPDEWKQSSIDEINTAIAAGWCHCGCTCPNIEPAATFFLGTWTAAGCTEADDTNFYALCNPSGGPLRQAWAYGQQAASYYDQFADKLVAMCVLEKQVLIETAKLINLGHIRDAVCEGEEAPHPDCIAAIAAVNAQQDVLQSLGEQHGILEAAALALRDQGDVAADQSMAALAALHFDTENSFNIVPLFQNFAIPVDTSWPVIDPKTCCKPIYCAVGWTLQWRTQSSTNPFYPITSPTSWSSVIQGKFGPTGKPYLIWSFQCPLGGLYICYSNHCSVGAQLPICQGVVVNAVRLVITYPIA